MTPPSFLNHARIRALKAYAPEKLYTNADFEQLVETTDEWIVQRTGIHRRHVVEADQFASDLCIKVTQSLVDDGLDLSDVDLIITTSSTPDYVFPSLAALIQNEFNIKGTGAIDVGGACAGFVYALNMADGLIGSGQASRVLVIAAETLTKTVDYKDRTTCVLFGDGAGAALLEKGTEQSHFEHSSFGCDGSRGKHLWRSGMRKEMGDKVDPIGYIHQDGQSIYKWAVQQIPEAIKTLLDKAGLDASDIDWFIPHSANIRIVDAIAAQLGFSPEHMLTSMAEYGNTSSASIPLALAPAIADGRIARGDRLLLFGFGGGLVYSGSIIRW